MTRRQRIEAESFARFIEANWPSMLGGNLAIAARLSGARWIHTPATPEATRRVAQDGAW